LVSRSGSWLESADRGLWPYGCGRGAPKFAATKTKKFTKAEARLILERDLAQYAAVVKKSVSVPINENQYGALVSFTYNLGPSNFLKSTLLKKLNNGDYEGAAAEFKRWNRAGGQILKGLTRRRAAEAALFLSGATTPATPETPAREPRNWLAVIIELVVGVFSRLWKR
jgi:lysozyme